MNDDARFAETLMRGVLSRSNSRAMPQLAPDPLDEETLTLFAMGALSDLERDDVLKALDHDAESRTVASRLLTMTAVTKAPPASVENGLSQSTSKVAESLHRGRVLMELGHHQAAVQEFQSVVAVAPGESDGWWELGRAYRHLNELATASVALQRAVELAPTDVTKVSELAQTLVAHARPQEAIDVLKKTLAHQLTVEQRLSVEDTVRQLQRQVPPS